MTMLEPFTAAAEAPFCCPGPPEKNLSGPDEAGILCYIPDGCCGPDPCQINEEDFICQVRSLLPEGDPYNNTAEPTPNPVRVYGAMTVGCARVGCEQLIFGGCCGQEVIPCEVDPVAPQLAVVDAFGAAAYAVVRALCAMLNELDPCTAERLIRQWADRMGIKHWDPCGPGFSDYILKFLICLLLQLRHYQGAITWEFLTAIANRMGADIKLKYAGDLNCKEPGEWGWWSMARDEQVCPVLIACPPDPTVTARGHLNDVAMRPSATCESKPLSLNIVVCPGDVRIPDNCNLPAVPLVQPHDPELFDAFYYWLLPRLLEGMRGIFWCTYICNPADCVI